MKYRWILLIFMILVSIVLVQGNLIDDITYWSFDTNLSSDVGREFSGTAGSGATRETSLCKLGSGCIKSTGASTAYITYNHNENLIYDSSLRTFNWWFNITAYPTNWDGMWEYGYMNNNQAFGAYFSKSGSVYIPWVKIWADDLYGIIPLNLSEWTMSTFVWNGTYLKLYINGILINQATKSVNTQSSSPLTLLSCPSDSGSMIGYIDEFAMWTRSLSDSEISQLYNSGNGFAYPFSEGNIISVSVNPSQPYVDQTLNCNAVINIPKNITFSWYVKKLSDINFIHNISYDYTTSEITSYTTTLGTGSFPAPHEIGTVYKCSVSISEDSMNSSNVTVIIFKHTLIDDLWAYYSFDNQVLPYADSVNANSLTATTGVQNQSIGCLLGGCINFTGVVGNKLYNLSPTGFLIGSVNKSVQIWIKAIQNSAWNSSIPQIAGWGIDNNYVNFQIGTHGGYLSMPSPAAYYWANDYYPNGPILNDMFSRYQQLVLTYDVTASNTSIYVDGVFVRNSSIGSVTSAASIISIGCDPIGSSFSCVPAGTYLDEIGFWNKVLTSEEVNQLWSNGYGLNYPFSFIQSVQVLPLLPFANQDLNCSATLSTSKNITFSWYVKNPEDSNFIHNTSFDYTTDNVTSFITSLGTGSFPAPHKEGAVYKCSVSVIIEQMNSSNTTIMNACLGTEPLNISFPYNDFYDLTQISPPIIPFTVYMYYDHNYSTVCNITSSVPQVICTDAVLGFCNSSAVTNCVATTGFSGDIGLIVNCNNSMNALANFYIDQGNISAYITPQYPKYNETIDCHFNVTNKYPFNVSITWYNSTDNIIWDANHNFDYLYQNMTSGNYVTTSETGSINGTIANYSYWKCLVNESSIYKKDGVFSNILVLHPLENLIVYSPPDDYTSKDYLRPIFSVIDLDGGINCNLNSNGQSVGSYSVPSGTNFTITNALQFSYTLGTLTMDDGCSGTINLSATSLYNLEVCIADSNNVTISESCKIYVAGTYGQNSTLTTSIFNLTYNGTPELYRVKLHWKRIQYGVMNNSVLNNLYDYGATYSTNVYDSCTSSHVNTFSICGENVEEYIKFSVNSNCLGGFQNSMNGVIYSDGSCTPVNIINTAGIITYTGTSTIALCRAPDSFTFSGTNATTNCQPINSYKEYGICSCHLFNSYYTATSCTAGTSATCPLYVCSYAGDTIDYSTAFLYSGIVGSTSVSMTDKIQTTGLLIWNDTLSYPIIDGSYYWNISCIAIGDTTPIVSQNRLFIYDHISPQFTSGFDNSTLITPQIGDIINMNISVTDNLSNISVCKWYMNDTGTYEVKQIDNINGYSQKLSFNYIIQNYSTAVYSWIGWYVWCNDSVNNSNQSDIVMFKVKDITLPYIFIVPGNGFNINNLTVVSGYKYPMNILLGFYDYNLFQMLVNVTCDVSGQIFYHEELDLNSTIYIYNASINLVEYPIQKCYVYVSVSDDHTSTFIPEYFQESIPNGLQFVTEHGTTISIKSLDNDYSISNAIKKSDRYSLDFLFSDKKVVRKFKVIADKSIYPRYNSNYPGHLVIWDSEAHSGNWIDFSTDNDDSNDVSIECKNKKECEITVIPKISNSEIDMPLQKGKKVKLTKDNIYLANNYNSLREKYGIHQFSFKSIGGTNIQNVTWEFYIGSYINVTGINAYNGSKLSNFDVNVTAVNSYPSMANISYHSSLTSVGIENVSQGTYILGFSSPNGRYYNSSMVLAVTSSNNYSVNYSSCESYVNFNVRNVKTHLPLNGYNLSLYNLNTSQVTNLYGLTSPSISICLNADSYTFNISRSNYAIYYGNFTTHNIENLSIVIDLSFLINFYLYDEKTSDPYNISAADSVEFQVHCLTDTLVYPILTNVVILPITCEYRNFEFIVWYGGTNYPRSFMLESDAFTEPINLNIYLINFATTTTVSNSFIIDDLLDEYKDVSIYIKKIINGEEAQITANYVDVEKKIIAYLIQNHEYIIEVHSSNKPTRIMGRYQAYASGDKQLRLYDISIDAGVSDFNTGVYKVFNIYTANNESHLIGLYNDTTNNTQKVQLLLYQDSLMTIPIVSLEVLNTPNVEFDQDVTSLMNNTLYGKMIVTYNNEEHAQSNLLNTGVIKKIVIGMFDKLGPDTTKWILMILISIFAIFGTISTRNMVALATLGLAGIFVWLGYFAIGSGIIGFGILIVIFSFIKEEEPKI